ncbi:MAG TPA: FHA domain-containing protein, partial [Cyclobacteriaceae bacterium]|nr:FHA domain-containing protein [Cyclobacteriaceae bacterium]
EVIPNSTCAKIRGEKGEYRETIIYIHDGFVIGRGSLSDLKFNDSSISRRHTLFRFSEGAWFIQDLGSGSGTFVNGKKIDGVKLTSGDRISFGSNVFTFLSER